MKWTTSVGVSSFLFVQRCRRYELEGCTRCWCGPVDDFVGRHMLGERLLLLDLQMHHRCHPLNKRPGQDTARQKVLEAMRCVTDATNTHVAADIVVALAASPLAA